MNISLLKPPFSRGPMKADLPIDMIRIMNADGDQVLTFTVGKFDGSTVDIGTRTMVRYIVAGLTELATLRQ